MTCGLIRLRQWRGRGERERRWQIASTRVREDTKAECGGDNLAQHGGGMLCVFVAESSGNCWRFGCEYSTIPTLK